MKKFNKFLLFSLMCVLCVSFMQPASYADTSNNRTNYITSARCDIEINDGELVVNAICRAREGKTIYGEIIIQRKGRYGWYKVESFDEIGYNGKLYAEEFISLNGSGKYRAKLKVTCVNETYTTYSNIKKY